MYEWLKILIRLFHNCIDIKKKGHCNKNLAHNSGDKPLPWTVQRTKPHTDKPQTQRHGGKHIHQKHAHANTYSCHVFPNNYTHASNTHNHRGGTFPQCTCRKNASLPHEIQTSLLIQSAGQTNTHTHTRTLAKTSHWGANSISFPMLVRREQRNQYTPSPAVLKGVLLP